MKKLFAIVLATMMICSLSMSVCAAPGSFIESPSFNKNPELIDFDCSDSTWQGQIFITSYGDRNTLEPAEREKFEAAYESIRNSTGIATLVPDIVDVSAALNVSTDNLGVSDLFYIGITESTDGSFNLKVDTDTLNNFVGLIYYEDGKWYLAEDAEIVGGHLTFTATLPKAYAVVVDVDNSVIDAPITGDIISWVLMAAVVASAAGIVIVLVSYKKRSRA